MKHPASHLPQQASGSKRSPLPYLIGAAIGLLNIGAFAAFRKGIGVSGAFESGAALAARQVAPDAMHVNDFVKAREHAPKLDWESCLVAGTVLGGMLMARAENRNGAKAPDHGNRPSPRSPVASAAGGALLMYGARMAGGCTSGHALSGTAQGAASSWVFTPLMFLVGSLVARTRRASQEGR